MYFQRRTDGCMACRFIVLTILLSFVLFSLIACDTSRTVTGISLNKEATDLAVGGTEQLIASIEPSDAAVADLRWSPSDGTIVSVDSAGIVTGLKAGEATVTVTTVEGGFSADCDVSVSGELVPAKGIVLNETDAGILTGGSVQLMAWILPYNATNQNIVWSSSDPSIADVTDIGLVTARGIGDAVISAATADGNFSEDCIITIPKLTAPNPAAMDYFGSAVAIYGDYALVAASEAAYIYDRDYDGADSWTRATGLTATDAAAGDNFGSSVSINGTYALVGAPYDDDGGDSSGSAYVFYRDQGGTDAWGQLSKLTSSDAAASDCFGYSVDIDGDYALLGAFGDSDDGSFSGSAYIFYRHQGGTNAWGQSVKLTASDAAADDYFGLSVGLSGDYALIGAKFHDHGAGIYSGAAYLYYRNQGGTDSWGQLAELTASDGGPGDYFANSLSIDGDYALIGACGDDDNGTDAGAAYIFYRNQGGADSWGQLAKLTASDGAANDNFGTSVALSGDYALVGADETDEGGTDAGAVYIFYRNEGGADNWGEVEKLTAFDAAAGDKLGISAALEDDTAVVGASWDDNVGTDSGAAYLFDLY